MDSDYRIFPTRKDLPKAKITFRPTNFFTNFYPIRVDLQNLTVYQYQIIIDLPDDSSELIRSIILELKPKLKKSVQFLNSSGKILFGLGKKEVPLQYMAKNFQVGI